MSKAIDDVIAERSRQIEKEGWTLAHDDEHTDCSLVEAAIEYAHHAAYRSWVSPAEYAGDGLRPNNKWPKWWSKEWWKPTTPRRDLVKAAALLIAEIDRLDRIADGTAIETQNDRVMKDIRSAASAGEGRG